MENDNHKLIGQLALEYTEYMSGSDDNAEFTGGDIAAAYIIGAEKTLRRVCNVIRYSAEISGLSKEQADTLLRAIEAVESTPTHKEDERTDTPTADRL